MPGTVLVGIQNKDKHENSPYSQAAYILLYHIRPTISLPFLNTFREELPDFS